tara:strand:+ start:891 stop:1058 length:168 start_codon:yes stop_codon:yes gene_type:complete
MSSIAEASEWLSQWKKDLLKGLSSAQNAQKQLEELHKVRIFTCKYMKSHFYLPLQ